MNFRIIIKIFGLLAILVGIAMGACLLYAWFELRGDGANDGERSAVRALGIATAVTGGLGLLSFLCARSGDNTVLRREAMIIVGLSWIVVSALGALPYLLCEPGLDLAKAFFESVSGFTTTGATAMNDIEAFPRAILLWRSVTQWLGGVGILVVFVALLSFLGVGSRSLVAQESSLNLSEAGTPRVRDLATSLLRVYLVFTVTCGIGLVLLGMPIFDAVCHAMTTAATGGFSPKGESIAFYQSVWIERWVMLFMFLSSIGFIFYVLLVNRKWSRVRSEEEAKYYACLLAGTSVAIAINLCFARSDEPVLKLVHEAAFNVISISSTTGYGLTDYNQWPLFSKLLLMMLMIIGGCAGSTSGGMKMNRIVLFFKIAIREMVKSYRPTQVFRVKLNGITPPEQTLVTTLFIITLGVATSGVSMLLVAMMEPGLDLVSVVGTVFGTLWNIGPGFGDVGPMENFSVLKDPTLGLLSFLMILGRLEFFALMVLFIPSLWKRY